MRIAGVGLAMIEKLRTYLARDSLCTNVGHSHHSKNCLLLYISLPFRRKTVGSTHQNLLQVRELAKVIGEYGYNVDVMDFDDQLVRLKKKYDLVIDLHPGLNQVYRNNLNEDCLKVAYITGSNPSFANQAEAQRIEDLFSRKGVRLRPRRQSPPFPKDLLESFDAMFFIGNPYNLETYNEFKFKKIFLIKNTGFDQLRNQDFSKKNPNNFLFLGSVGQVHKGLDLLLDVFSKNAHLNLYICANYKGEKDFCKLYRQELFNLPNVFPYGFIDVTSDRFRNLAAICSYTVMPSCSEGISGGVLAAMSAGLIPIVSRECGLNPDEVHFFEENNYVCIAETLNYFAQQPLDKIQAEALKTMDIIRDNYSMSNFSQSLRVAMAGLLQQ